MSVQVYLNFEFVEHRGINYQIVSCAASKRKVQAHVYAAKSDWYSFGHSITWLSSSIRDSYISARRFQRYYLGYQPLDGK